MIQGRIKNFTKDILSGKQNITLEIDGDITELVEKLKDDLLSIDIKKFRKKRSLTANSYYWALVHKISEANGLADIVTHNLYLRDCRCLEYINGETVAVPVPDTEEAEQEVLHKAEYHLTPTSRTIEGKNGTLRFYLMLRGSSDFDGFEMNRLINFAVQDAQQLGIPVITENEQRKLIELYGRRQSNDTKRENQGTPGEER